MSFPEMLFKLRTNSGMSQAKLAKELCVSQASINYWEKGERDPSITICKKIAAYFGLTLDELLGTSIEEPLTLAAHFDGTEYTKDELDEIRQFAEFIKSKRK